MKEHTHLRVQSVREDPRKILPSAVSKIRTPGRGLGYPIRDISTLNQVSPWTNIVSTVGMCFSPKLVTILGTRHVTQHEGSLIWFEEIKKEGKKERKKEELGRIESS